MSLGTRALENQKQKKKREKEKKENEEALAATRRRRRLPPETALGRCDRLADQISPSRPPFRAAARRR